MVFLFKDNMVTSQQYGIYMASVRFHTTMVVELQHDPADGPLGNQLLVGHRPRFEVSWISGGWIGKFISKREIS